METNQFNERFKQIGLLSLIVSLGILLFTKLYFLLPGFLFALTLYMLLRTWYVKLIYDRKLKPWQSALLIILLTIILLAIPVMAMTQLLWPKIQLLVSNQAAMEAHLLDVLTKVQHYLPENVQVKPILTQGVQKVAGIVPSIVNGAFSIFTNLTIGYFFLYFMLVGMRELEQTFLKLLPMSNENQNELRKETRNMIISNAIGIPVLAIAQGIIAFIGYLIFGVPEPLLWAVITALFSFVPIVGTVLIWLPLGIYLMSTGHQSSGIYLLIYSAVLLTNIDNVLRFTVLKKIGDVHPLITVLGVIVGLNLFGFFGLIFGPLLISYFLLLIKIYKIEYTTKD